MTAGVAAGAAAGPPGPPVRVAAPPPAPSSPVPDLALPALPEPPVEPPAAGGMDLAAVRGLWTEVLNRLRRKRVTWALVKDSASVVDVGPGRIVLGFPHAGLRDRFSAGVHAEWVRQALIDSIGLDVQVEAILDPSAGGPGRAGPPEPAGQRAGASPAPRPAATRPAPAQDAVRAAPGAPAVPAPDDGARADDPDLDDAGLSGRDLLVRELGATVIGEYDEGA